MLTKKLIAACKSAALVGRLAFGIAATVPISLANNSTGNLRIVNEETVASNSSPNVNPTFDNEGSNMENYVGNG